MEAAYATARMGQLSGIGIIGAIGGTGFIQRFGGLSGGAGGCRESGGFRLRGISKGALRPGETGRRAVMSGS